MRFGVCPPEISIVIPVFNEEGNITALFSRLKTVLENQLKISYEIIFVDDGSEDNSWQVIESLHKQNGKVLGFRLSKNFGHQYALKAGLDHASGKAVVSLDGDLQHPPELIKDFYEKWQSGYKIVYGIREDTKGVSIWKELIARIFYKIINFLSDTVIERGASDFRLLDQKVVREIRKLDERQLFVRVSLAGWGLNPLVLVTWLMKDLVGIQSIP